jgi:hypothetical protein
VSVAIQTIMLSEVMPIEIMLSEVMLSEVMLSEVMLSEVMLIDVMLSLVMLSDSFIRKSHCAIMQSVIIVNVAAPSEYLGSHIHLDQPISDFVFLQSPKMGWS